LLKVKQFVFWGGPSCSVSPVNQGVGGRSRAGVGRTKEEGENRGRFCGGEWRERAHELFFSNHRTKHMLATGSILEP